METLVLSNGFEPVARVSWKRAITLLFEGKVEVVEEYEDRYVRSVTIELKVPSVVRFLRNIRRRKPQVKFSRENVYARDKRSCQYCGRGVARHEATYDHVTPRSRGGKTAWENIVIACVRCNQDKGGRTPAEAGMRLKTAPVKPSYLPGGLKFVFGWEKGMPTSWRNWLRDYSYWNGELETD